MAKTLRGTSFLPILFSPDFRNPDGKRIRPEGGMPFVTQRHTPSGIPRNTSGSLVNNDGGEGGAVGPSTRTRSRCTPSEPALENLGDAIGGFCFPRAFIRPTFQAPRGFTEVVLPDSISLR